MKNKIVNRSSSSIDGLTVKGSAFTIAYIPPLISLSTANNHILSCVLSCLMEDQRFVCEGAGETALDEGEEATNKGSAEASFDGLRLLEQNPLETPLEGRKDSTIAAAPEADGTAGESAPGFTSAHPRDYFLVKKTEENGCEMTHSMCGSWSELTGS